MRSVTHDPLDNFRGLYLLDANCLHGWFICPFLDHNTDALTEPFALCSSDSCCTTEPKLHSLPLWVSVEAEGSLGLRSTHGLSCSERVAATCLANTSALTSKGHLLWPK